MNMVGHSQSLRAQNQPAFGKHKKDVADTPSFGAKMKNQSPAHDTFMKK